MKQLIVESSIIFTDNDVYFIETVSDKIIINNNYEGVLILDSDLKVIKEINLMDDLIIDLSFIFDKGIVLWCYEKHCLIYINLKSFDYNIILLKEALYEVNFLPLYEWKDNKLLLLADDGATLACVDILNGFVQVTKDIADGCYSFICRNWDKINRFTIYKVYSSKNEAIVEKDNIIRLINYEKNTETILKLEPFEIAPHNFYDVEVMKSCIVQVSEKKVIILNKEEKLVFFPNTPEDRFFRAKFIVIQNKVYLLLLSGSCSDSTRGTIEKYCIET